MDFPSSPIEGKDGRAIRSSSAAKSEGWWYVYRLQSIPNPSFGYTGVTTNLRRRLHQHNRHENPSTASYAPLRFAFIATFPDKFRALEFESYLKSGSGHAFAKKRLW